MTNYTFQHTWDQNTAYVVNDIVFNNGDTYICSEDNVDKTPHNTRYWRLISKLIDPLITESFVADGNIPTGRCVSINTEGKMVLADQANGLPVIGVSNEATSDGDKGSVTTFGLLEIDSWDLTIGNKVFLGRRKGQLTYNVPANVPTSYEIGTVVTTTSMYVNIRIPIQHT